jgi:hypothetical protein
MMLPLVLIRSGRHSRAQTKAVSRLSRVASAQSSSEVSKVGPAPWPPALAIRMSIGPKGVMHGGNRLFDIRRIGRITHHDHAAKFPRHSLKRFAASAHQHHIGTFLRQPPRNFCPDTGAAPSDQRGHAIIALQFCHGVFLRVSLGESVAFALACLAPAGKIGLSEYKPKAAPVSRVGAGRGGRCPEPPNCPALPECYSKTLRR